MSNRWSVQARLISARGDECRLEPIMHAFVTFLFFAAYVSPVFVVGGIEAISRGRDKHTPLANA